MLNDLRGKAVVITGGTMGIGLATGLAFGREGASVTLTHKWGSADEDEIRALFREAGAPEPRIVQADAGNDDDTLELLEALKRDHDSIHAVIANVSFGLVVHGLAEYEQRSLHKSVDYSAWPMYAYGKHVEDVFGRWPRHIVGLSSGGPDYFYKNYDFVAASKAVMETMCRYMSYRLFEEGCRVNVVRSRLVPTESLRATFGRDFEDFAACFNMKRQLITTEEVGGVILALCSGLLDGVNGQVIMVDRGTTFCDDLMRLYEERGELNLELVEPPEPRRESK